MKILAAPAVLILVVGIALAPRLFDRSTWALLESVRALGPISGWRCAQSATYGYEPKRERPDPILLAEPPEMTVVHQQPGVEIERVEADLRGGDTLVWTRALGPDGGLDEQRVYVLTPGRLQAIGAHQPGSSLPLCNTGLGDWRIVEQHKL